EHADISTGGIGTHSDWTLTLVRTDTGRVLMEKLVEEGWIETRPGDSDPKAIETLQRLAANQRKRWPDTARDASPSLLS
ncbi:MAG: Coenzyme F420 hydrogenase/dehydrogenase, beta subunit C-terminal domain, partial [Actinobacteria bacterium]|nr:Coenzyme F420 hydrogenase/dehydrogenase, beta subunit C-terminal domain [Actinomycetota bacterium]